MRFRQIRGAVISDDGAWVAYGLEPDRGDGEGVLQATNGTTSFTVARGASPVLARDGRWAAFAVTPPFAEREKARKAKKGKDDGAKPGMALASTSSGVVLTAERIESFAFSDDAAWIAYLEFRAEEKDDDSAADAGKKGDEAESDATKEEKKRDVGGSLHLRRLATGTEVTVPFVKAFAFDETSRFLAYAVAGPEGAGNGVFVRDLVAAELPERPVVAADKAVGASLSWARNVPLLAFLWGCEEKPGAVTDIALHVWDGSTGLERTVADAARLRPGWEIPAAKNDLAWSDDGRRLFFGTRPRTAKAPGKDDEKAAGDKLFDPYDTAAILEERGVDVWNVRDPRIVSEQKQRAKDEKDRSFLAMADLETGAVLQLADEQVPEVAVQKQGDFALGTSEVPYLREATWAGRRFDAYAVDLHDGSRKKVAERLTERASIAPGGRFVAFFNEGAWHLADTATGAVRDLSSSLGVPFADEDHDEPSDPPSYGLGGWLEGDAAVLVNDKYDVWQIPVSGGTATCLTAGEGRTKHLTFRVQDLDPERDALRPEEELLLTSFDHCNKGTGFAAARLGAAGVRRLVDGPKTYELVAKAAKAETLLVTRESYEEFPDLWVADRTFSKPRRLTTANPQIAEFAWGSAELVTWSSADGRPLEGVLIKPGGWRPGTRVPMLVYYYERSSQRLHRFNEPVVNHRPSFPLYASNGYAIFLPDVWYEEGRPGLSAAKCLVPGVQKLVDMGVADPKRVALHGHSWSGYQTAFVVTQTDIFAAAIAGAPVANMTSAYGGIRWESGVARQWQYEMSQSRLGASLWERRDLYVENSPLFYADRITTPLLLMHGDEDGAVPWTQSIEMVLAMRRLGKPGVLLTYRGEGHHPKTYANKLDYAIKMKEFLDHFLKGRPAPAWWSEGVPYAEEDTR